MDRKKLFVQSFEDLKEKTDSNNEYHILKSSGLVRAFFLDSPNLVDTVNREFRQRLQFVYSDSSQGYAAVLISMNPDHWAELDGFYPGTQITQAVNVTTGRDSMFSQIVLINSGETLTVKDVIKYVANVMGGVHPGNPKENDAKEQAFSEIASLYGGLPAAIKQLQSINRVILEGLEPLYVAAKPNK